MEAAQGEAFGMVTHPAWAERLPASPQGGAAMNGMEDLPMHLDDMRLAHQQAVRREAYAEGKRIELEEQHTAISERMLKAQGDHRNAKARRLKVQNEFYEACGAWRGAQRAEGANDGE